MYAAIQALQKGPGPDPKAKELAKSWQHWLDYAASTAPKVFYQGNGKVCAVVSLNQSLPVNHPKQSYSCESPTSLLDDPYEGETLAYFLQLYSDLPAKEKEAIWAYKRSVGKLAKTEYKQGNFGPITVRKGLFPIFWTGEHHDYCLCIDDVLTYPFAQDSGSLPMKFGTSSSSHTLMSTSSSKSDLPARTAAFQFLTISLDQARVSQR